jgi:hypothetical protein
MSSNKPKTYKVRVNMMQALPRPILRQVWEYVYSGVVLKELLAKTVAQTRSSPLPKGLSYLPTNCPSQIRFRFGLETLRRNREVRMREWVVERENARKAKKLREDAIRKRDFDDWFALTGSDVRMSKRKKVTF